MPKTRRGDLNVWWRFGVAALAVALHACFRLRVLGAQRVPRRGPAILAANHVSGLDGPVLAVVTAIRARRMTRFLVAAEFFRRRRFGWALRLYRQIPLRRGEGDASALDDAIETVRAGALAGIFPEGRVNGRPLVMQRGHTGLARIALASGAPVVPVGIWGTQDRWPLEGLHARRPWRPALALAYGEPIEPGGRADSTQDVEALTGRVMDAIEVQAHVARAATVGRRGRGTHPGTRPG